jgi:hypothetical protein
MTNNHGDPPLDPETKWTKVTAYAAKNKELKDKRNKEKGKSFQNNAQEEEIEASGTGTNAPKRTESNYVTRINFKVIPEKNSTTLLVLNSIVRIMAATKFVDPTTRISPRTKTATKPSSPVQDQCRRTTPKLESSSSSLSKNHALQQETNLLVSSQ